MKTEKFESPDDPTPETVAEILPPLDPEREVTVEIVTGPIFERLRYIPAGQLVKMPHSRALALGEHVKILS